MAYVITERCVKCGACESECPNGAIVEEEKKFAIVYSSLYLTSPLRST